MAKMKIRHYTKNDIEICRSLWVEMVQRHRDIYDDQSIGGENPGLEFDHHLESVGPEQIWLADLENQVIGLTSLIQNGEEAEIEPVIVSHQYRGKGIGELLIKHAIDEAKIRGVLCLSVKPVARNKEAISFFYDCGFRTLGHIQLFMWLGESAPDTWKSGMDFLGKSFKY